MKRLILYIALFAAYGANAQSLSYVLQTIEANNTSLASLRGENAATIAGMKSETSIMGPTSVEYSPFWGKGVSGLASSELVVQQEFDFPTLGGTRNANVAAQGRVLDMKYRAARRDVLLEAKKLCYDLSYAVESRKLLQKRELTADSLLTAFEKNMRLGNATIIDVNRIKMDRMVTHTQVVKTEGDIATIIGQLQALNGGKKIDGLENMTLGMEQIGDLSQPNIEEYIAQAEYDATAQDIKLAKSGWLPSFSLGYRRNTDVGEAVNGFIVGVSVPLFGNSSKVKAAQAKREAAQVKVENTKIEIDSYINALLTEAKTLRATIDSYDMPLMQETLALINRAIAKGALTIVDYYTQADRIYGAMGELLELQNRYNKIVSDLNDNQL